MCKQAKGKGLRYIFLTKGFVKSIVDTGCSSCHIRYVLKADVNLKLSSYKIRFKSRCEFKALVI